MRKADQPGLREFTYAANPARVIFGSGTLAKVPEEIERLGIKRALLLSTPSQAQDIARLANLLGAKTAAIFNEAAMHTPVTVTERAMRIVSVNEIDGLVALGGGSTTGLAKAIALKTDLPQIIVPTTYAGSEMTPILGQTEDGIKTTIRSERVLPEVVVYDVDLTLDLPVRMSAASGLNAIAHAAEALYSRDLNPILRFMAMDGIHALAHALPRIQVNPRDTAARADALYGAWLCGSCLGQAGMALHHKLCHVVGGTFDLPHAETHAVLLPHALAYNAQSAPAAMADIAAALGVHDAALGLFELAGCLGIDRALKYYGMPRDGVVRAVELTLSNPYWNPRALEAAALTDLLLHAHEGSAPVS
jgi:maleylacetate reductase